MTTQPTPKLFKITPDPTFWWPVRLTVPGVVEPVEVEIEYKHHSRAELDDYWAEAKKRSDKENLSRLIMNWRRFDADFTQENLALLLDRYPTSAKELYDGFQAGQVESRAKN